jgi:hypothetical protein
MTGAQIEEELHHRYLFALQFLNDRDVLDVGSGDVVVSQVARSVIQFPADDSSIDVILSLEISDPRIEDENFVCEAKRVLRPNGLLMAGSKQAPALLLSRFRHVRILQQLTVYGSVILDPAQQDVLQPTLIVLASDGELPPTASSILNSQKLKNLEIAAELAKAEAEYLRRKLKSKPQS